jgi:mannose-1-phosphate guanylyltransferase
MRWAIVLAGGVGSRFWPLSSAAKPKQMLPLASDQPLLLDAIDRLDPLIPRERTLIVTSRLLADSIRKLSGLPAGNVLAEPRVASTAAALAWATAEAARRDPSASVLSTHADWAISNAAGFRAAAQQALETAERHDMLVTVAAEATRPETGYGWVIPGTPLDNGARRIARFEEKPTAARAAELMAEGGAWNTGLFAWTAKRLRAEIDEHTKELHPGLKLLDAGDAEGFFAAIKPVAIDVGVWERTKRGAVVTAEFGWDDVGSWAGLRRARKPDENGNVTVGAATGVDSQGCVIWSDAGPVVVYGMRDTVVVHVNGVTLVTTAERSADLKKLLDKLPPGLAGDRGA